MATPVIITQGNLVQVTDVLLDQNGNPVNLAGATVAFTFQQNGALLPDTSGAALISFTAAATIVTPAAGAVAYQFTSGQTAVLGDYFGQWSVTLAGVTTLYPIVLQPGGIGLPGLICFQIAEPAPIATPDNIILVRQMREPIRAILGDFKRQGFQRYSDEAIDGVVRTCLSIGRVPGQKIGRDRLHIVPGIIQPSDLALLMYHSAKVFVTPNIAQYSYQTRALEEKFGRSDHFIFELNNAIYELENGQMVSTFQSFYAWVNALTGIDIWSVMSDMTVSAPVATVSIGRAGVVVQTTS